MLKNHQKPETKNQEPTEEPETAAKPKETSLYLPAEVKAQIEALKIVPNEALVDVVRRLVATKELHEGETVMLTMPKKSFAQLQMVLQSVSPGLADLVARSVKK